MRYWAVVLGTMFGMGAMVVGLQAGGDNFVEACKLAARYTARAGFPLLIVAYSASSLAQLWPNRTTRALKRDRRQWGLGFAVCHTFHLFAFVAFFKASGQPVPLLGAPIYVLMYLMVLTSNSWSQKRLGSNWKRLHTLGIHALWFAFALAYVGKAWMGQSREVTLPFAMIALGALGLRIAAWRARRLVPAMA